MNWRLGQNSTHCTDSRMALFNMMHTARLAAVGPWAFILAVLESIFPEKKRLFFLAELSGSVASRKQVSSKIIPQLRHFTVDLLICWWFFFFFFFFLRGSAGSRHIKFIFFWKMKMWLCQGRGTRNAHSGLGVSCHREVSRQSVLPLTAFRGFSVPWWCCS